MILSSSNNQTTAKIYKYLLPHNNNHKNSIVPSEKETMEKHITLIFHPKSKKTPSVPESVPCKTAYPFLLIIKQQHNLRTAIVRCPRHLVRIVAVTKNQCQNKKKDISMHNLTIVIRFCFLPSSLLPLLNLYLWKILHAATVLHIRTLLQQFIILQTFGQVKTDTLKI